MPSSLEKVSLSLSGTSAANSTFDFLADEFEEEARTRENLDELAWKLYERYMAAHDEDFEPGLSLRRSFPAAAAFCGPQLNPSISIETKQ